jgi:2-polyprenyl-6-methoxyphenol hydroxylase-like FAD-dependent oxidoreductase
VDRPEPNLQVADSVQTGCCVVGAGPAGMVLGYLLARAGVGVVVLEKHGDFLRDFRGDTIHPSTLEVLAELGLADRLHQMPHGKLRQMSVVTPQGSVPLARLDGLRTPYPYVMILPQEKLLEFLAEEARRYPAFRLVLGARVEQFVQASDQHGGAGRGLRASGANASRTRTRRGSPPRP